MKIRFVSLLSVFALLAACGGGGGSDPTEEPSVPTQTPPSSVGSSAPDTPSTDPPGMVPVDEGEAPPDPVDPVPSKLEETLAFTDAETVALAGIATFIDGDTGERVIVTRDGSYVVADETQTLAGKSFELTSDVSGAFLNASSFVQETDGVFGIVGIATLPDEMPVDGSATFIGGAAGFVIVGDTGIDLTGGTSTVTVQFEDSTVSVDMTNFQVTSQITGNVRDGFFDTLTLTDASITGTGFSGGTLETSGGQSVADIVGANARLISEGQFFGTDPETALPAEVGGLVLSEGDAGKIFGSFIAD